MSEPLSTPTEGAAAIEVAHLSKVFAGGVRALDGIDVSIPVGTLTALVGPNGSGKSTFMDIVAGAVRPTAGRVRVQGRDAIDGILRSSAKIGYGTQELALDPEMSGMETLRLFHALRGLRRRNRTNDIVRHADEFGILPIADRRVSGYSGGERQRLHLATETIHSPSLLLLDEPTSSLDPSGRRDFWRQLRAWRDVGRSIVVASHDLGEIETHADLVLIMARGRLLATGSPYHLATIHGAAGAVITVYDQVDESRVEAVCNALADLSDVHEVVVDKRTITIWRRHHPQAHEPAIDILTALGLTVERYERIDPSLAAAYFRLTGGRDERRERVGRRRSSQ